MKHDTNNGNKSQTKHINIKICFFIMLVLGALGAWYMITDKPDPLSDEVCFNKTLAHFMAKKPLVITEDPETSRLICKYVTLEIEAPMLIKYIEDNDNSPDRTIEIKNTYKLRYGVNIAYLTFKDDFSEGAYIDHLSVKDNFVPGGLFRHDLRNLESCVISVEPIGSAEIFINETSYNGDDAGFINKLKKQLDSHVWEKANNNQPNKDRALATFKKEFLEKFREMMPPRRFYEPREVKKVK